MKGIVHWAVDEGSAPGSSTDGVAGCEPKEDGGV